MCIRDRTTWWVKDSPSHWKTTDPYSYWSHELTVALSDCRTHRFGSCLEHSHLVEFPRVAIALVVKSEQPIGKPYRLLRFVFVAFRFLWVFGSYHRQDTFLTQIEVATILSQGLRNLIEKLENNAWHYKNRKKWMENFFKCHWTLKNVQTFRAEPFISVKKPIFFRNLSSVLFSSCLL